MPLGRRFISSHHQVEKVEVGTVSVNIKPLEDRIVVKPLDAEQTTACLLYTSPSPRDS